MVRTALALPLILTACFPTLHTARVEPGLRLDVSAMVLHDQPREGRSQGADGMLSVTPKYGFRDRVELGLPFGVYWEEGFGLGGALDATEGQQLVVLPYVKVALLPSGGRDHLAVFGQAAVILPGSVGVRYGRDMGWWEPHVGLTWLFSGGQAGDSPIITRYQQRDQTLILASAGATLHTPGRPVVEVGVLHNRHVRSEFVNGNPTTSRFSYLDAFVAFRVGLGR
jgi:hypothetical protein